MLIPEATAYVQVVPYLHRDPSGAGAHGYCAHLYQEVTIAISGATALHLIALGILKVTFKLHHENVKVCVGF